MKSYIGNSSRDIAELDFGLWKICGIGFLVLTLKGRSLGIDRSGFLILQLRSVQNADLIFMEGKRSMDDNPPT